MQDTQSSSIDRTRSVDSVRLKCYKPTSVTDWACPQDSIHRQVDELRAYVLTPALMHLSSATSLHWSIGRIVNMIKQQKQQGKIRETHDPIRLKPPINPPPTRPSIHPPTSPIPLPHKQHKRRLLPRTKPLHPSPPQAQPSKPPYPSPSRFQDSDSANPPSTPHSTKTHTWSTNAGWAHYPKPSAPARKQYREPCWAAKATR